MEEQDGEDAGRNSSSSESLSDTNQMNSPYINAPSVFPGTSDCSTTASDESLYVAQLVELGEHFVEPDRYSPWIGEAAKPVENPAEFRRLKQELCLDDVEREYDFY